VALLWGSRFAPAAAAVSAAMTNAAAHRSYQKLMSRAFSIAGDGGCSGSATFGLLKCHTRPTMQVMHPT